MKKSDILPKSIKKTIRYILRDTDQKNLLEIERQLQVAIPTIKETLQKLEMKDFK